MIKLLLMLITFLPLASIAQTYKYVSVDPDGYTNVREKPNANAKILGMVNKYYTFTTPNHSCYDAEEEIYEMKNWLPIVITEEPKIEIGYIYKKYLKQFDDFPQLPMKVDEDDMSGFLEDEEMKFFIAIEHNLNVEDQNDVDMDSNYYERISSYKFKNIIATYKGREYIIPKSKLEGAYLLYNPLRRDGGGNYVTSFYAYKGHEGIYYLTVSGGDGADVYDVLWVFDKGKLVRREFAIGHCTLAPLDLLKVKNEY